MKSTLDASPREISWARHHRQCVPRRLAEKSQVLELVECFVLLAWIDSGGYRP